MVSAVERVFVFCFFSFCVPYVASFSGLPIFNCPTWEEFEDTKGLMRIHISKRNRQHNGQKKKNKQLEIKTHRTCVLCGNRNGYDNTELRM
jgi:hypothetical protein